MQRSKLIKLIAAAAIAAPILLTGCGDKKSSRLFQKNVSISFFNLLNIQR